MTTKYLEIDSTYRNRTLWPLPSHFVLENTRPTPNDDPISDAMPTISWQGGNVNVSGSVVSSNAQTVIITATELSPKLNYYTNAILSPPETRILSYRYIGSNQAEITVNSPLTSITTGTLVTISDTTNLALNRLFVPGMAETTPSNYYIGQILYDETTGGHATITYYDKNTGTITVSNSIPGWTASDSYNIRMAIPIQTGTAGPSSTASKIVGVLASQIGSFARILPTYPSIDPAGQVSRIVNYDPFTSTATVFPPYTASPASFSFEILAYTDTNVKQLTYVGTTQVECVNSVVKLLNLMIPNQLFSIGYGGYPINYPYLYVKLTPRDSSNINVNCSNNPNGSNTLFRATNTYVSYIDNNVSFVKFSGDNAAIPVRFKIDTDLVFQVTLPNGQPLDYTIKDTTSPVRPNPMIQISALFEITRNH